MKSVPLPQILCTLPQIQHYFHCHLSANNVPIFIVIFEAKLSAVNLQNTVNLKTISCFNRNKKGETKVIVKLQKKSTGSGDSHFRASPFPLRTDQRKKPLTKQS